MKNIPKQYHSAVRKLIKKAVDKAKREFFTKGIVLGATGQAFPEKEEEVINLIKKEL